MCGLVTRTAFGCKGRLRKSCAEGAKYVGNLLERVEQERGKVFICPVHLR
jgi:hypothetical protein